MGERKMRFLKAMSLSLSSENNLLMRVFSSQVKKRWRQQGEEAREINADNDDLTFLEKCSDPSVSIAIINR